jgi:uncharacterized RDD family membrane protein YckC
MAPPPEERLPSAPLGSVEPAAPGFARRLACLVYEGLLLFGVLVMAGYLYAALTQQRHALQGQEGLRAFLFLVLGIYFTWFWSNGRQTLAMKTWHIRLVDRAGRPLSQPRAAARYALSWIWFLQPLGTAAAFGHLQAGPVSLWLAGGVLGQVVIARFLPGRQYLHDVLCGTRLVDARTPRTDGQKGGAESQP